LRKPLANKISSEIQSESSKIRLVDRSKLTTLLQELNLQATGILSKQTAVNKGRMLGINALVTGKYKLVESSKDGNDKLYIYYKLIDLEAGEMIFSDEVNTSFFSELEIIYK